MTNAQKIRAMSDEELAMFLCNFRSCDADEYICEGCKATQYCRAGHAGTIDWLQQPAEDIGVEPKPCPFCNSAEVFYGEYDTFSDSPFGGYKIRCKCGYAYRKSVWCDSANEAMIKTQNTEIALLTESIQTEIMSRQIVGGLIWLLKTTIKQKWMR